MSQDGLSVIINIDGGARGNPGPAGAGVVIRTADDDTVLHQGGTFLGTQTNNAAEYAALLAGLEAAAKLGAETIEVISDSQLLVRQMNGQYRVKNANLQVLYAEAQDLLRNFKKTTLTHVRREFNTAADKLVNQAVNARRNVEDAAQDC